MTDSGTQTPPSPDIPDTPPQQVAEGVWVLPDHRIDLVPNVGIVVGDEAALVVDTGMGPANGRRVLERARELAGDRPLTLTLTHFHPEHGWGAQAFPADVPLVYNRVQLEELEEKFEPFVELFATFGPAIAEILAEVELARPRLVYDTEATVDLGGTTVELRYWGAAHTRGDQVTYLPRQRVLFAGDLVENRFFPILPDPDAHGSAWIDLLARLEGLEPEVVVPGHGEVGGAELIREAREYLETVRGWVGEEHEAGRALEELKEMLEPRVRERWADWDNEIWIGFAIENFAAELGG